MNLVRTPRHGPGWNIKVTTKELRKIASGDDIEFFASLIDMARKKIKKLDEAK